MPVIVVPNYKRIRLKHLFIIKFFLYIPLVINAQIHDKISISINGGLTYSNILQKDDPPWDYDYQLGFNSGVSIELELKSNISIMTNICYYQNGYNLNDQDKLHIPDSELSKSYLGYEEKVRLNYFNNSWVAGYSFGKKIEVSIYGGLYWAIFLNGSYKFKNYIFIDYEEWIELGDTALPKGYKETINKGTFNEGYSSFDFGVTGGIKLAINLNQKFQLFCFPRYNQGIIDIYKPISTNLIENQNFNCSFNINLGINMKL
jgi:hypothetical protein